MFVVFSALLLFVSTVAALTKPVDESGTNWAVLIAGSNGYYNYRHQADISHAYQILSKMGSFPAENIITLMYNDVANSPQNPLPGRLYNEPGGVDVYDGVRVDYQGDDVTAETFLNVLRGNASGVHHRPVLKSGPNDRVFIYYSDHGASGLVAMPTGPPLYANDLIDTLQFMNDNGRYSQLVFYLESCESGSMFAGLLANNTDIFATTAANPSESSYAYYYNATLSTYMADEYSIRWMQDSTATWNDSQPETLWTQFVNVRAIVNESHVQQYGDVDFDDEAIEDFEAFEYELQFAEELMFRFANTRTPAEQEKIRAVIAAWYTDRVQARNGNDNKRWMSKQSECYADNYRPSAESVDSRDVVLATLQHRFLASKSLRQKEMLALMIEEEIENRLSADILFTDVISAVSGFPAGDDAVEAFVYGSLPSSVAINFRCLKAAYESVERSCAFEFGDYSLKYVRSLVNMCAVYGEEAVLLGMYEVCVIEELETEEKFEDAIREYADIYDYGNYY